VLVGTGLFVICGRLNRQGIKTVRGNTWKTHAMRRVLRAPRRLEAQIKALLFAYLDKEIKAPQPVWQGQARLEEVNAKIAELMEQYRTGLSGSIVFPMIRRLEGERNDLQTEQTSFNKIKARKQITLTGEWDDLDLYAKREVIQSVIEAVVIRPTGRTGLYDPSRVDVIPLQ